MVTRLGSLESNKQIHITFQLHCIKIMPGIEEVNSAMLKAWIYFFWQTENVRHKTLLTMNV